MLASWRVFPKKFKQTPLGTGPGDSRFATEAGSYTVIYAAPDFATAFVETVVRDRFLQKEPRKIRLVELTQSVYASLRSQPSVKPNLLDLRGDGIVRLGAPTDAVNARNHSAGQALGRTIHDEHEDVDGILFASRLTGQDVYALFDRAIDTKLLGGPAIPLLHHPELEAVLERFDIVLGEEEAAEDDG
jgi:hypothetical protein